MRDLRNVGGTPGGMGPFLLGLGMAIVGGYLLLQQVTVHGGFWRWGGAGYGTSFGLTLIPLLVGVGFLFADSKSKIGWALTAAGALIIVAGIIVNLNIHFRSTSLYNTLLILVLLAGGLGLIVRSVRPMGRDQGGDERDQASRPDRRRVG